MEGFVGREARRLSKKQAQQIRQRLESSFPQLPTGMLASFDDYAVAVLGFATEHGQSPAMATVEFIHNIARIYHRACDGKPNGKFDPFLRFVWQKTPLDIPADDVAGLAKRLVPGLFSAQQPN